MSTRECALAGRGTSNVCMALASIVSTMYDITLRTLVCRILILYRDFIGVVPCLTKRLPRGPHWNLHFRHIPTHFVNGDRLVPSHQTPKIKIGLARTDDSNWVLCVSCRPPSSSASHKGGCKAAGHPGRGYPTCTRRSRSIAAAGFPEARVIVLDGDRRDECEMIYGFSLQHEQRPFDRPSSFSAHPKIV